MTDEQIQSIRSNASKIAHICKISLFITSDQQKTMQRLAEEIEKTFQNETQAPTQEGNDDPGKAESRPQAK
jgi:hypothetical protein